jgi:hypothetical protein
MLAWNGMGQNRIKPLFPEFAFKANINKIDW